MFLSPYQHGVVREITENGLFEPTDSQFQNYPYATHDLNELVAEGVIKFMPTMKMYAPGEEWSKVK